MPVGPDEAWQKQMGSTPNSKAPTMNFYGQTSPYLPPDANGTVGHNYYMQTINVVYAIYDNATGALVAGPTNMNQLFSGVTGSEYNNGDPLILFDEQADRWLAVEFSISGSNDYMLVAVSQTNDPTGSWHKYSFDVADMPDYEKFGIWRDGYYMGTNNGSGNDIYVFERAQMLIGGTAQMVGFNNPWRPSTIDGFHCVPPLDNDGAFAPEGSPGLFITLNDDAISGGSDQLWIYELDVNWTSPSSSTFTLTEQIGVTSFDSNFGNNWDNIKQLGTNRELDAIPMVIMNRPQFRNFGSFQTIVCSHTVDVDGTDHAGIRWYELRRTTGNWSVRQTGTYAPDEHSRWMASIALNGTNEIGLGYSVSSTSMYPGIRYCGQSAAAYAAGNGVLDMEEGIIQNGSNSQTAANRWGDYANLAVDPDDDHTFWFTTQYGGSRQTKIASFEFAPPALNADFSGSPLTVCVGESVLFTDASTGSPTSWDWTFSGGSPGTYSGQTPPAITYNVAGTYDVSLTVSDGTTNNTEAKIAYITVTGITADFSGTPTTVVAGNSVSFTDNSSCNPTSWSWLFPGGTPNSFIGQNPPAIVYNTIGSYDVSLTVTNASGNDTKTMVNYITATDIQYCSSHGNATAEWIASVDVNGQSNTSGSSGSAGYEDFTGVAFNLNTGSSYTLTMDPGFSGRSIFEYWQVWIDFNHDGDFTDAGELVFSATKKKSTVTGTINIPSGLDVTTLMRVSMKRGSVASSCEIFSQGEVEDYTVNITEAVPQPPVANFSADKTTVGLGEMVQFTDLSTNNPTSWSWTFTGGTPSSSSAQNPAVSYSSVGIYDVSLTATNGVGSDTETKTSYIVVTNNPPPLYCEPAAINNSLYSITSVSLGSTTSNTGQGSNGYVYYSTPVFDFTPGQSYSVTLVPNNSKRKFYWRIWMDLNNDGDFLDADETVFQFDNVKGTVNSSMTIPSNASGSTRMRISMKSGSAASPCEDGFTGEVEDYDVTFGSKGAISVISENFNVELYPNPVSGDELNLKITNSTLTSNVVIYDKSGQILENIKSDNDHLIINTSSLKAGLYFIKISNGQETIIEKFIKM